ncbi:MAG TPA: hypothetical protein ENK09_06515 [Nitrospirae bacterium]|nr:hypothetical protein [Nitrospirota bacterium]
MQSRADYKEGLNKLKELVFYKILELVGRVFIIVRYHEDVRIGRRGFLPEEREKGIVLVFNKNMNFTWHDWGIEARLVFGSSTEHCLIPVEHIIGVYSPELNTQFLSLYEEEGKRIEVKEEEKEKVMGEDKVIKVDFKKKS